MCRMTSETSQRTGDGITSLPTYEVVGDQSKNVGISLATNAVTAERKRPCSDSCLHESDTHVASKIARYSRTVDDHDPVVLKDEVAEKVGHIDVDVAQHIEVKLSDDEDDGEDDDDLADGEMDGDGGEVSGEQRIYPCPMTSSGGRPRKHPAQPPKYLCQYCGRGCQKPSVLAKHIRAHTNERPYPCELCGFAFKTKSNLYKHSKSKTHHDKLNSVLQSKRLSTLTDCNPPAHVTPDARSADSGSPASDNHPQNRRDTPLCSPGQAVPPDASEPQAGWSARNNVKNEVQVAAANDESQTRVDSVVTHSEVALNASSNSLQLSNSLAHELSPADRNAKRQADANFAVKAKLRSHIEQKQSGGKAANHEEPPSPRGTHSNVQQLASVSSSDSSSAMSLATVSDNSPKTVLSTDNNAPRTNGNARLDTPVHEEDDANGPNKPSNTNSQPADTTAGDPSRRIRQNGKLSLQVVMRDHNLATLQSALCLTWSVLKKRPICSLLDPKTAESMSAKTEGSQPATAAPSASDVQPQPTTANGGETDKQVVQSRNSAAKASQNDNSQSRIDVLLEASDLVSTPKFSKPKLSSGMPFVPSSLDLLAEAAEAASKMDSISIVASRVPSPAEHVDIVNSNAALNHAAATSKAQSSTVQNANTNTNTTTSTNTNTTTSSSVTQLLTEPRKYMCHLCSKPFPKEHTLLLHLKVHAIEAPFRCSVCRVSYGKLSRLKRHQLAKGHAPASVSSASASSSTVNQSAVSSSKNAEQSVQNNGIVTDNELRKSNSRTAAQPATSSRSTNEHNTENKTTENRPIVTTALSTLTNAEHKAAKPATVKPLDTTLTTRQADKQKQVDMTHYANEPVDKGEQRERKTTKSDESFRPAIPVAAISATHVPYLATATNSSEPAAPQSLDPKFLFLGGPHVGMPVGLSNGPLIAAFMPFNGYTLVPTPGGLYLATQAQQTTLGLNALGGTAQVLMPSTNHTLHVSNISLAQATDSSNHNNEPTVKTHAPASVSESNSDKDNADYDGGACTSSRPFRCETCNRGFRVQGHLNKHMRSKIHHENVANLDAKSQVAS